MTAPSTTGILRSRPRYASSADHGDVKNSDGDGASANNSSSSADATAPRIKENHFASDKMGGKKRLSNPSPSHKHKTRSLADLVKSSANLSAEASDIADSERGNVISHQIKMSKGQKKKDVVKFAEAESMMSTLQISERGDPYLKESTDNDVMSHQIAGKSQKQKDVKKFIEAESMMSTLHISEKGAPYLKVKESTDNNNATSSGPDVVDAETAVLALGVMGEDGQQVRFCEYDDVNNGEINDGTALSSRDRLEQSVDAVDDNDVDVDEEGTNDGNGYFSDSENSGGSAQDEEILREFGLLEGDENYAEDETNMEESKLNTNSEELRSFRVLWELLSRWTTPSTTELVLNYQGKFTQPQQDESSPALASEGSQSSDNYAEEEKSRADSCDRTAVDIGASRRASISSMLNMSIPRSLSELKKMQIGKTEDAMEIMDQRKVAQRLADLVSTFDSSAPAANLNMKMWKGLTTILIAIAFPSMCKDLSSDEMVPPSIQALKMSAAEYRYLTQSAIVSLSSTV